MLPMEAVILDNLLDDINAGRFSPGELLPSENVLSSRYRVSRLIVRNVYNKLEEMGYLTSRKGKGRILTHQKHNILLDLRGDESFTDKLLKNGINLRTLNSNSEEISYHSRIWQKLNLKRSDSVYKVERLRIIDDEPTAIHTSYVHLERFPDLYSMGNEITSMFQYFRNKGHAKFLAGQSKLSVALPKLDEQELLACPGLVPILVLESLTFDEMGEVLQFSIIKYRSDSFDYAL
jgi:GntR family transcriptional regulator